MKKVQQSDKKEPIIIDTKGRGLKALKGQTLSERFYVGKNIDKGSYGKIFACDDLQTGEKLVVKFSEDYKILAKEIQNLKKFQKVMHNKFNYSKQKHICHLIDYGMLVLDNFSIDKTNKSTNKVAGYYIMPKYDMNLEDYLNG